jgi:hypothetical protein
VAYQTREKKNYKNHSEYLGDLRESTCQPPEAEKPRKYGQQKERDDII